MAEHDKAERRAPDGSRKGAKPDARVIGLPGGRLSDAGLRDGKETARKEGIQR